VSDGAGRKSGERERSVERTFQKMLELERSRDAAERRAGYISPSNSLLTSNISLI